MTNREWLSTLTDEEFVMWMSVSVSESYTIDNDGNRYYLTPPMPWTPTAKEVVRDSTNAVLRMIKWLSEERIDFKCTKNEKPT